MLTGVSIIPKACDVSKNTAVEGPFFTPGNTRSAAAYKRFLISRLTHFMPDDFKEHIPYYRPSLVYLKLHLQALEIVVRLHLKLVAMRLGISNWLM